MTDAGLSYTDVCLVDAERAVRLTADPTRSHSRAPQSRLLAPVFGVAVFLAALLLFLVQPLAARFLLPIVGGSASLWNTAMVFFQVTLLLGYGFAHASARRLPAPGHVGLQMLLLLVALIALPVAVPGGWSLPNDVAPSVWVLGTLLVMVGLPFFALATMSPTLQVWFASTDHPRAADPYFLYATGNAGSVLALVCYPLVLEPLFALHTQARIWAVGFGLLILATGAAALLGHWCGTTPVIPTSGRAVPTPIALRRRARWVFWSFTPSALMLGLTLYLTTDIASFPLLWVVPLLLYLSTFIIAFAGDSPGRTRFATNFVWYAAVPLGFSFFLQQRIGAAVLLLHLCWFFAAALVCHSKLAMDRPETGRLTDFYMALSFGGALGGVFASLVAPVVFNALFEYAIAIALAVVIAKRPERRAMSRRWAAALGALLSVGCAIALLVPMAILYAGPVVIVLAFLRNGPVGTTIVLVAALAAGPATLHAGTDVYQDRSFFGVYTVVEKDGTRTLASGTTAHGSQLLSDEDNPSATSYYHRAGPAGQVFEALAPRDVGVIGLGVGTLADYGRTGDRYVFYEIDQLVVDIARDREMFGYLHTTDAEVSIIVADGRQGLSRSDDTFDLLVVDAFGSDAIPVHLLTAEAIAVYLDHLDEAGTLLVHISNRHLDLRPVLAATAEANGATAYAQRYIPTPEAAAGGATSSEWVAIAGSGCDTAWLESGRFERLEPGGILWTDDFSNVLGVLRMS